MNLCSVEMCKYNHCEVSEVSEVSLAIKYMVAAAVKIEKLHYTKDSKIFIEYTELLLDDCQYIMLINQPKRQ